MDKSYQIEVCANSVESALNAQNAGADRVELCAGMPEGGTTPSIGQIMMARELLTRTKLHVIIRPRGGDFLYTDLEVQTMIKDIQAAKELQVDGIVIGCLTANGDVDIKQMEHLMREADGLSVTFHRAFDMCPNPHQTLQEIIALGCDRILTSGQQPTAVQGIPMLKQLQMEADENIIIMPGCGINPSNIQQIANETGTKEFHLSGRTNVNSRMRFRNPNVSMGGTVHIDEYVQQVADEDIIREAIHSLKY
jgi:copper homeostasis protein